MTVKELEMLGGLTLVINNINEYLRCTEKNLK